MFIADTTLSKLSKGSPIPIITTLVTFLSCAPCCCDSSRTANHTCPIISPVDKLRLKPCFAVEQNEQFNAHPTWEETQRVPRFASGMYTVSMQLPQSSFKSHL